MKPLDTKMIRTGILIVAVCIALPGAAQLPDTDAHFECKVPIRAVTSGKAHWFGYYDKEEFDPTDRYVLAAQVDFEDRSPEPDDSILLGMVDTQDGDKWILLAESNAWGWQPPFFL